ncbi:hypothetical protein M413DRAFT_85683 [Hebeloma cylindrosporum]|uniref:Uncharacterized protein n=1 Tax=Hebeloma cylindrosporum TaxID=76867 RepID=A0A0C3CY62_HEBCY|nr:hypothetical protein M413DRAFT_85683 [Hebeloma cylindrosporum h7]
MIVLIVVAYFLLSIVNAISTSPFPNRSILSYPQRSKSPIFRYTVPLYSNPLPFVFDFGLVLSRHRSSGSRGKPTYPPYPLLIVFVFLFCLSWASCILWACTPGSCLYT